MDQMPWLNRGRFDDIIRTNDSCYLAIGNLYSGSTYAGLVMHKYDINGMSKWTKIIYPSSCNGITGSYESHCVIEAKDHGFAVSGSCGAPGGEGMFLFKTDSAGNPEWFRAYYDYNDLDFWFRNLCQDQDSGFVFFNQYANLNKDALIIHTDKSGNLLMSATLDSTNYPSLNALFNIDGDVYLCFVNGFVKSNLDTSGFWLPTYTTQFGNYKFKSMEKCMNSDLILSWDLLGGAFGTLRTDANGIPLWARANIPGQVAGEFYERPDRRLIYQGTHAYAQNTFTEVILFDSTGNMDCFNGPTPVLRDSILEKLSHTSVFETPCSLAVYVPPVNWHEVGIVSDNCLGASVADNSYLHFEAFPNPTTGIIQLKGLEAPCTIEVFGIDGRRIISLDTRERILNLDFSGYPKGLYAIRLLKDESATVLKIVLQ